MAFLRQNKPARPQFRTGRRLHLSPTPGRLTGCTVLHTAESILDTVGPDTGAENVARFMVSRTTPGSYHDLVDSDSNLQLVDYADEAYQDGTGSNPWALSISWALKAADWPRLSPARRAAFLAQGAAAFHRQQAWLTEHGHPTTPLRRISKAQSDAGQAGFITHGDRDPGRRTDPGARFPWDEWFRACTTPANDVQEDDMYQLLETTDTKRLYALSPAGLDHIQTMDQLVGLARIGAFRQLDSNGNPTSRKVTQADVDQALAVFA